VITYPVRRERVQVEEPVRGKTGQDGREPGAGRYCGLKTPS
jgi:hypothetical protein